MHFLGVPGAEESTVERQAPRAFDAPVMPSARRGRHLLLLIVVALGLRLALLAALHGVTGGREFADDFKYYRVFMDHPLMLIDGVGMARASDAVIYAPLVPLQVWFPGKFLSDAFGTFLGQRLAMIAYDVLALGITAWVMILRGPERWTRRHWIGALALMCVPGSFAASALWGQEDSIAALWVALALLTITLGHPTLSALFGAFGLFTHKLFALLLSLGIWGACRPSGRKIIITTGAVTILFVVFLLARWHFAGHVPSAYQYNAVGNSPSPWSLVERVVGAKVIGFDQYRPFVIATTAIALLALTFMLRLRDIEPEASVVATHAAFFTLFLGIQPEHQQWFMPFLIYFAWKRWVACDYLSFACAWSFSAAAYGYKIAYGLQGATGGKVVFRDFIEHSFDPLLDATQLALHLLTLAIGVALVYRAAFTAPRARAA